MEIQCYHLSPVKLAGEKQRESGGIKFLSDKSEGGITVILNFGSTIWKEQHHIYSSEKFNSLIMLSCAGLCLATPRCPSVTRRRTRRSTGRSQEAGRAGQTGGPLSWTPAPRPRPLLTATFPAPTQT